MLYQSLMAVELGATTEHSDSSVVRFGLWHCARCEAETNFSLSLEVALSRQRSVSVCPDRQTDKVVTSCPLPM